MPIDAARRQARTRVYIRIYAVVGGAWMFAHAAGLLGGASQYTFVLLTFSAIVATVIGSRAFEPSHRWPFVVIMIGFVLFVVGGAARESLQTLGDLSASRSITPDALDPPGICAARPRTPRLRARAARRLRLRLAARRRCSWRSLRSRSSGRTSSRPRCSTSTRRSRCDWCWCVIPRCRCSWSRS